MTKPRNVNILPLSLPPRGLRREQAAEYIGVSVSLFDKLVAEGRMPPPKMIGARKVWDRVALDQAFFELPEEGMRNSWSGSGL